MVVPSLAMQFDRTPEGAWTVDAPWLDAPVVAATVEEAYDLAIRARPR